MVDEELEWFSLPGGRVLFAGLSLLDWISLSVLVVCGTLWGLRVVASTAMTQGTGLVGDFAGSCVIYDRMAATVEFSTQTDDAFVKNGVIFRGESRIGVAVTRPSGFCTVTGL